MTDSIETPTEEAPKRAPRAAKTASETLPQSIIAIIPLIRAELGVIDKGEVTEVGTKFAYRGHDTIVNAIAPLFNKYGVFTTVEDESVFYGGRDVANSKYQTASVIRKAVRFYGPDGNFVTSTVVAESLDNGNKATTQAQTYAYRIALTQTFTIPTGDPDPDSNNEDSLGSAKAAPEPVKTQPANAVKAAPADDEIKALKGDIAILFRGRGVTDKDEIVARGTKFFHGREGWDSNVVALNKLKKALEDGEEV